MGSTEIIKQFEKKKKDGLACFKESIQVCCDSERASIYGYCGIRLLYARKKSSATLLWFCLTLQPRSQDLPLAFEMQPEVLGSFGRAFDKIPPNIVDFGWMEKSTRWHSKLFLSMFFNDSLSFCLHHQGLERDLEDLGCFFRFFSCVLNGINRKDKVWSIGRQSSRETFRSSKVSSLNVGLQSKNWKTSW